MFSSYAHIQLSFEGPPVCLNEFIVQLQGLDTCFEAENAQNGVKHDRVRILNELGSIAACRSNGQLASHPFRGETESIQQVASARGRTCASAMPPSDILCYNTPRCGIRCTT